MLCCKRAQIIWSLIFILGCGFQPAFKKGTESIIESEMRFLEISPIKDRIGQKLRNHLVQEITPLGRARPSKYRLIITLSETKQNLAIKKSEIATRANLQFVAKYDVISKSSGALLTHGSSRITTSFNILNQSFATMVAEKNARDRAVREISADIGLKIAGFFRVNKSVKGRNR